LSTPPRKNRRFLAPQEKYEIWMQLVKGETTVGEAADRSGVDRSAIAKLRDVARQGALAEMAVKLTLAEKSLGIEWPHPQADRCGHQEGADRSGRRGSRSGRVRGGGMPLSGAVTALPATSA
jgi:hypothetical protein